MIIKMQQVHGNKAVIVDGKFPDKIVIGCDALITNDKNVILEVKTADCLPISIVDNKLHVIGLVHAGWRGLENGIIKNTLRLMCTKFKVSLSDVKIKIGPHICQNCYEIKNDVLEKFENLVHVENQKKYLNLSGVAIDQLVNLGVLKENITIDKRCTFEDRDLPSYRRDKTSKRFITSLHT